MHYLKEEMMRTFIAGVKKFAAKQKESAETLAAVAGASCFAGMTMGLLAKWAGCTDQIAFLNVYLWAATCFGGTLLALGFDALFSPLERRMVAITN